MRLEIASPRPVPPYRRVVEASAWLKACAAKKEEWAAFKRARFEAKPAQDAAWQRAVLCQPAAIKVVADFAKSIGAAKFFDAGDVQANGFQIVEARESPERRP